MLWHGCDLADDVATASNGRSRFEYLQRRAVRADGENIKWGVDDCGVLMSLIFDSMSMSMFSHFRGRCRCRCRLFGVGFVDVDSISMSMSAVFDLIRCRCNRCPHINLFSSIFCPMSISFPYYAD